MMCLRANHNKAMSIGNSMWVIDPCEIPVFELLLTKTLPLKSSKSAYSAYLARADCDRLIPVLPSTTGMPMTWGVVEEPGILNTTGLMS